MTSSRVLTAYKAIAILALTIPSAYAQTEDEEFDSILAMDIDELIVTSVSLREESLSRAAAAIYVITGNDIKRMGATSIPDALRMVPGLEVAQLGSNRWAITSRGFNSSIANKMQVLIDGRSVYTPIFSGVYWDDQSTFIDDIDRIEVIRGPGGTLYGANAVNGVINVITKNAAETQGNLAVTGLGNEEGFVRGRHGGAFANGFYRAYAEGSQHGTTANPAGHQNDDEWKEWRSGFRVDGELNADSRYKITGDIFENYYDTERELFQPTPPFSTFSTQNETSRGGNIVGTWTHDLSTDSQLEAQAYLDHYNRNEAVFGQSVTTADLQLRHHANFNERNHFIWGGGVRQVMIKSEDTYTVGIRSNDFTRTTFNIFAQNEYEWIPDTLFLTLGSKLEHNPFTELEIQPNARLSYQPTNDQTFWAAVSRAVRTPSEIEDQSVIVVNVDSTAAVAIGGLSDPDSETLIAYELGHRIQAADNLTIDSTVFYNDYDNLLAFGPLNAMRMRRGYPLISLPFENLGKAQTYGTEITSTLTVSPEWQISGNYSYLEMDFDHTSRALFPLYVEGNSPEQQIGFRSYWNIASNVQFDNMLHFVDRLEGNAESYWRYDTRLGWEIMPGTEVSVIGRNLLNDQHEEFSTTPLAEIERSFLAVLRVDF